MSTPTWFVWFTHSRWTPFNSCFRGTRSCIGCNFTFTISSSVLQSWAYSSRPCWKTKIFTFYWIPNAADDKFTCSILAIIMALRNSRFSGNWVLTRVDLAIIFATLLSTSSKLIGGHFPSSANWAVIVRTSSTIIKASRDSALTVITCGLFLKIKCFSRSWLVPSIHVQYLFKFFQPWITTLKKSFDFAGNVGLAHLFQNSISRRLTKSGINTRVSAVKDILTVEHHAARLHFARRYFNTPIDFWWWVIFTDENSWSSSAYGQ